MRPLSRIFVCLTIVMTSSQSFADPPRTYFSRDGMLSPIYLHVDSKIVDAHFFSGYSELATAMASNPEAAAYAARASRQAVWANSFIWGGLVGAVGYAAVSLGQRDYHDGAYWLIFLGGFIPGIFIANAEQTNLMKAMNIYNGIKERKFSFIPQNFGVSPTISGAVGRFAWSF